MDKKLTIAYYTVSEKGTSQGHVTRGLAIYNALKRAGWLSSFDFYLIGTPDAPELWPEQDKVIEIKADKSNRAAYQFESMAELGILRADVVLIDGNFSPIYDLLTNDLITEYGKAPRINPDYQGLRPRQAWLLIRWYKNAYQGIPKFALDRIYQIERFDTFQPPPEHLCRSKKRSAIEKETGKHWSEVFEPYREGSFVEWQQKHHKPNRALIAPIVNVDPELVLSREIARKYLCDRYGLDPALPLAISVSDSEWAKDGYQIIHTDKQHGYLPDIYRYLPGVDLYHAPAGYNTFYEWRYLRQLGLADCEADFFTFEPDLRPDQIFRLGNFRRGYDLGLPGGNLDSNDPAHGTPEGNGADFMAKELAIFAGLIKRAGG